MKRLWILCLLLSACAHPNRTQSINYYQCGTEAVLIRQTNDGTIYLTYGGKSLVLNRNYRYDYPCYTDITGNILWMPAAQSALLRINNDQFPSCRRHFS